MAHRQYQHTGLHPAGAPTIPDPPVTRAAFAAGNVPGFTLVALDIHQLIVLAPAQHEAQTQSHQQTQPEATSKALVKDMHHSSSPLRREGEQQLGLFIALEGGLCSS